MTISGERTEQLDIFCHVTGFTSDFLSFIDVELIRFFHGALQLSASPSTLVCVNPGEVDEGERHHIMANHADIQPALSIPL